MKETELLEFQKYFGSYSQKQREPNGSEFKIIMVMFPNWTKTYERLHPQKKIQTNLSIDPETAIRGIEKLLVTVNNHYLSNESAEMRKVR